MSQTTTTAPQPAIPADVLTFAEQEGVTDYLTRLVDLTREVYPTASRFDVLVEDDPEIANDRHIVFELDVPIGVPQAREADQSWHEGFLRLCPAPLAWVFRLSANLRP
jgi:hypothetical protein